MNELYRAEDGTLRRRGVPQERQPRRSQQTYTPEHGARKAFFAIYCVFLTIAFGGGLYTGIAGELTGNETIDAIMPIAMIVGAGLACLIYGCGRASERGYDFGAFFAVSFWAGVGSVVVFWCLSLVPLIISSFLYIVLAIVAICFIFGIIGG
ncbi:MAG: hypothetical protein IKU61_06445 [Clostridia bacterium]|nr:hypothetical protein [Clostridia bacterium]